MIAPRAAVSENCDFCHASLSAVHQHVLELSTRKLACACEACAVLFSGEYQKYRRVPRRILFLPDFQITDAQWDSLMVPIGIVFFFHSSAANRVVALYPSPAGPVESLLPLESWEEIAAQNPQLQSMAPDVEGLLAYRAAPVREYYILPIDECFRLIGIIRLNWKGFSGGTAMRQEIGKFLETLKQKCGLSKV
jgi:uncharacterized protein DUF5947